MNRVVVKREFLGMDIGQMHDNKFFCLTDFANAVKIHYAQKGLAFNKNLADFMKRPDTLELIEAIQDNENIIQVYITKRGKNGGTYAHPLLLIEFAIYCDKNFKYRALNWIKDKLCEYRDDSGESYKTLSGVIQKALDNPNNKRLAIAISIIAKTIKDKLKVVDWNNATQEQLETRDKIHRDLSLLIEAGIHPQKALDIVINKY